MKTIKIFLTFLILGYTNILFSQNLNKSIETNTSWNGRMCNGGHGMCHINSNKSISNTKASYNIENNELILVISKTKIDNTSKAKITSNELEKGFYLYNFNESFDLPTEILNKLNIKSKTKIKQGNYLIKEIEDDLIIKLKLE